MTDNQFDDMFRNRLETYKSKVPADMWERINKKDKGRKIFIFNRWYMIALLFLLFAVGGYFGLNNYSNDKGGNDSVQNENMTRDKKGKIKLAQKNVEEKLKDSINDDGENKTTKIINENVFEKANSNRTSKLKFSAKTNTIISSAQVFSNNNEPGKNDLGNLNDIVIDSSKNHADNLSIKKSVTKKTKNDLSATTDENNGDAKNIEEDYRDKFSIELYASPDIPFNHIGADNNSYEQMLKNAGKMQFCFSLGAKLDIRIIKGFSGKIGVQYSQINEKMGFTDSILSTQEVTYNNHYKSIYVPLMLSYNTKWPGTIHTSVNTGVLLNISSKYKGAIPDVSGNTITIAHSNVYNKNTGVSLYLGIALSKEINKKTDIFAEPYFLYRINDMTTNIQSFNQKINTTGIALGLRYRLFKKED